MHQAAFAAASSLAASPLGGGARGDWYDPSVRGEAAWACLPRGCIHADRMTREQDLLAAVRKVMRTDPRRRLWHIRHLFTSYLETAGEDHARRFFVRYPQAYVLLLRCSQEDADTTVGTHRAMRALRTIRRKQLRHYFERYAQGSHFFRMLAGIEGNDPLHQWLFPKRGSHPQQDFEPYRPPCSPWTWRTVWGGDVRFLP